MAQKLNFTKDGNIIVNERLTARTSSQSLQHDCFFDVEVWTGLNRTGVLLHIGIDYTLSNYDNRYEGYNQISFLSHINEPVYVSYKTRGDYVDASDINEKADVNHSHSQASITNSGFISAEDYEKLQSIELYANYYQHPLSHSAEMIVPTPLKQFVTQADINRWNTVSTGNSVSVSDWIPSNIYSINQEVFIFGLRFRANNNHTSSSNFFDDLANWDCVSETASIVYQPSHGLSRLDAVYISNGSWVKARSNEEATLSNPPAIVISVSGSYLLIGYGGIVTVSAHNLDQNKVFYVSDSVAGSLVSTPPDTEGSYLNPVIRALDSNTIMFLSQKPVLQQDISVKTDKVSGATNGNLAGLNEIGNLTDSGYTSSDFAVVDHTHEGTYASSSHTHTVASNSAAGFMSTVDKSKLDGIAGNANLYAHPNHTGDVTSTGDGDTVIGNNKVINAKLAQMNGNTLKGNNTDVLGNAVDIAVGPNEFLARDSTTASITARAITDWGLNLVAATDAVSGRNLLAAAPTNNPTFTGTTKEDTGSGYYRYTNLGSYNPSGTGTVKISLPISNTHQCNVNVRVKVLRYSATQSILGEQDVANIDSFFLWYGTPGTPAFYSKRCLVHSAFKTITDVRLFYDSVTEKVGLLLGSPTSSWFNCAIFMEELLYPADITDTSISFNLIDSAQEAAGTITISTANPYFFAPVDNPVFKSNDDKAMTLQIGTSWTDNSGGTDTDKKHVFLSANTSEFAYTNILPLAGITSPTHNTKPGAAALVLHTDNSTAGGYAPLLVFSKLETITPYKAAIAAIGARTVTGTGGSNNYIDGELQFYVGKSGGSGLETAMTITSEKRVGIGITDPAELLDVNGNIKGRGYLELNSISPLTACTTATATLFAYTDEGVTKLAYIDSSNTVIQIGASESSLPTLTGAITSTEAGVTSYNESVPVSKGGTGSAYVGFTGAIETAKTCTLPNSNATLLYSGGALGTPSSGTLTNCTFPTLNQNTTGSAGSAKSPSTTGLAQFSGMPAGQTIVYTLPNSNATLLYSGGALGTPSSGTLTNCTFPTLNQNTTGNAATATKLTTARAIYGNNFDGSTALTSIIASTYGGTGNGFTKFSGPASNEKIFTLPNESATILTSLDTSVVKNNVATSFTKTQGFSLVSTTVSGATTYIDWTTGNKQKVLINNIATSLVFQTPPASTASLVLIVKQGSTGQAFTFGTTVKWANNTVPTFSTTANITHIVTLFYDGITYYGSALTDFAA